MLLIEIEDFAANLIGEAADAVPRAGQREADVVLPEDVCVVGSNTAADAEPVTTHARADRWRANVGDMQTGGIATLAEGRSCGKQSFLRPIQIRRDLRASGPERGKHSGARRLVRLRRRG